MPEHSRVTEASRLYQELADRALPCDALQSLLALQHCRKLSYGAWFGGTHGRTFDRYKIYVEIPHGIRLDRYTFASELWPRGLSLPHCHSVPVMLGFQPDTGVRELYFEATRLAAEDLGKLLWSNGLTRNYRIQEITPCW